MAAILENHQLSCLLTNWIIFDSQRRRAYFSSFRLWEGSLLCARASVLDNGLSYPHLPRMEDGFFINTLIEQSRVFPLSRPELYIYEAHATNTWSRKHFDLLFSLSQPLSPVASEIVAQIMDGKYSVGEASAWMSSKALLGELTYFYVNNFTHSNRQLERYRQSMAVETPSS
jgi:hypothetical protein